MSALCQKIFKKIFENSRVISKSEDASLTGGIGILNQ
jgi:hypothetical protein